MFSSLCSRIATLPNDARVHLPTLVNSIPQQNKRHFAKLVDAARRKRKANNIFRSDSDYDASIVVPEVDVDFGIKTDASSHVIEQSRESSAATVIQSSFRVDRARTGASHMQETFIEREAQLALANREGFLDIMAEILYNTVFNLMDEALHDEFKIFDDPLHFISINNMDGEAWNSESISTMDIS